MELRMTEVQQLHLQIYLNTMGHYVRNFQSQCAVSKEEVMITCLLTASGYYNVLFGSTGSWDPAQWQIIWRNVESESAT